jgi:hypothetical protein
MECVQRQPLESRHNLRMKKMTIAPVTGLAVVLLLALVSPAQSVAPAQLRAKIASLMAQVETSEQRHTPLQGGAQEPVTVPLNAASWILETVCNTKMFPVETCISPSPAVPLSNDSAGDLQFEFPGANAAVNYLYAPWAKSLAGHALLVMTVSVRKLSGSPIFNYVFNPNNTCINPAHLRPYIELQGDNGVAPNYRWWANEGRTPGAAYSYELDLMGNATITVPLTAAAWSNVDGQYGNSSPAATKAFQAALADPMAIGLTFGGGCFFGHGTNVSSGTAQFYLTRYQLQ